MEEKKKLTLDLWVPISLATCAYLGALLAVADWDIDYAMYLYSEAPSEAIAALGAIPLLLIGVIHLGVSQIFKGQRNPRSRRLIITTWSLASIALLVINFSQATPR